MIPMKTNTTAQPLDTARIEAQARILRAEETARLARAFGRSIVSGFRTLAASIAEARQMQRVYGELTGLSDKELRDIGLSRSDIPAAVAGTLRRPVELTSIEGSKTLTPATAAHDETARLAA